MKLLAFTDLHSNWKDLQTLLAKAREVGVEAVLCGGDFTEFGRMGLSVFEQLAILEKPVYLVPGNHEEDVSMLEVLAKFPFVKDVNGLWEDLGDFWLAGFGGRDVMSYGMGNDAKLAPYPRLRALRRHIPPSVRAGRKPFVFLTHYPPYGLLDGVQSGNHEGSAQVREFIEALRPALVVCGHIHEQFGREAMMGPTRLVNPGPGGMIMDLPQRN